MAQEDANAELHRLFSKLPQLEASEQISTLVATLSTLVPKKNVRDYGYRLLVDVVPDWLSLLTDSEVEVCYNRIFKHHVTGIDLLVVSYNVLRDCVKDITGPIQKSRNLQIAQEATRLLQQEFFGDSLEKVFCNISNQFANQEMLACICSLPEVTCRALESAVPSFFLPNQYYTSLLRAVLTPKIINNYNYWNAFVGKICRVGQSKMFVKMWMDSYVCTKCEINFWKSFASPWREQVVDRLLQEEDVATDIMRELVNLHWEQIKPRVQYTLLHKSVPTRTMKVIVQQFNDNNELQAFTTEVAQVWASKAFVHRVDYQRQRRVTALICCCLSQTSKADLENSELFSCLIAGVQFYMEAGVEQVRHLGMNVAQEFSKITDPTNPIVFPGLPQELLFSDDERERETAGATIDETPPKYDTGATNNVKQEESNSDIDDPDEIITNDEAFESSKSNYNSNPWGDSSSDSDSSLEVDAFDTTEHESVERIQYLREFTKLLMAEEYNAVERAVNQLAERINEIPSELASVSVELAQTVLYMDNRFNLDDFVSKKDEILVTLVARAPKTVVPYLHGEFYSNRTMLGTRLSILSTLVHASMKLSSIPPSENAIEAIQKGGSTSQVGKVLRRWGQRRQPVAKQMINEFAQLSSMFILPLLRDPVANKSLLERESSLLSRMILSIAIMLECTKNGPTISNLVKAFLELLWWSRFSNDAQVRSSTVLGFSIAVVCVPRSILASDEAWSDDLTEIRKWFALVAQEDPDVTCRQSAQRALKEL